MSDFFKCLYLFESDQIYVLEIRRTDLAPDTDKSELYRWLLADKDTLEITPLTFISMDSSGFSQERFFRQGYLSFDSESAIFIHESSSDQQVLKPGKVDEISGELNNALNLYLGK